MSTTTTTSTGSAEVCPDCGLSYCAPGCFTADSEPREIAIPEGLTSQIVTSTASYIAGGLLAGQPLETLQELALGFAHASLSDYLREVVVEASRIAELVVADPRVRDL